MKSNKKRKKRVDKPLVIAVGIIVLFIVLIVTIIFVQNPQITNIHAQVVNSSIDSTSPANVQPAGQSNGWHLVFSDEFSGNSLDLNKWIMCNPSFASSCNPYNNEQEKFNVAPNNPNVVVSGGLLKLITTKQNGQIWSGMVSTGPNVFNYNQPGYRSFQYTYGYYEGRVKIPKGNGFWPSLWELPDQKIYGAWPGSGEYDNFEIPGNNPTEYHFTAHWGGSGGQCGHPCSPQMATISDASATYHTYGLDWEPNGLTWYVDGKKMGNTVTDSAAIQNHPFYIIANFSVGGSWGPLNGGPDASTPFPAEMDIDYLRVWQKGAETPTTPAPTQAQAPSPTSITPTFGEIGDCNTNGNCPTLAPTTTANPPIIPPSTPNPSQTAISGIPISPSPEQQSPTPSTGAPSGNQTNLLLQILQLIINLLNLLLGAFK